MSKTSDREERLAAKLRENLRRRKSQARGMAEKEDTPSDLSKSVKDS